ncbi:MAG: dephospho-CoA kinase [Erysipelotrichaceae bacterium]
MKKIGLTGSIGCGKSTCIQILKNHHILVFDCDEMNHQLMKKGQIPYQNIVKAFGDRILNDQKEIDHQILSNIVFKDQDKKQQLEKLLHPSIKEAINKAFLAHRDEAIIVVEVPLLFEVNWQAAFDEIWVISCDDEIRRQRLLKRGMKLTDIERRMKSQMPQSEKIKRADQIINNNGSLNDLEIIIAELLDKEENHDASTTR